MTREEFAGTFAVRAALFTIEPFLQQLPPVSASRIHEIETAIGLRLPSDYLWYLANFPTGMIIPGVEIYMANRLFDAYFDLREYFGDSKSNQHHYFPFADDGTGGYYCFAASEDEDSFAADVFMVFPGDPSEETRTVGQFLETVANMMQE